MIFGVSIKRTSITIVIYVILFNMKMTRNCVMCVNKSGLYTQLTSLRTVCCGSSVAERSSYIMEFCLGVTSSTPTGCKLFFQHFLLYAPGSPRSLQSQFRGIVSLSSTCSFNLLLNMRRRTRDPVSTAGSDEAERGSVIYNYSNSTL